MNWTSPYHHLLILMISLTLHILLVLHILIMIILLFLLGHQLHVLIKLVILWVHWSFRLLPLNFINTVNQMRFDRKIFFNLADAKWFYICSALNIVSWMWNVLLVARRILVSCLGGTLFSQAWKLVIIIIIPLWMTANFNTWSSRWEIKSLHFLTKWRNVRMVVHAHCCPTFVVTILKIFIFESRILPLVAFWSLDIRAWHLAVLWFEHTLHFAAHLRI